MRIYAWQACWDAISKEAKKALELIINEYVLLQTALAKDDLAASKNQVKNIIAAISKVNMNLFSGESHDLWLDYQRKVKISIKGLENTKDIENIRKSFLDLSVTYVAIVESFGPFSEKIYLMNCPMANSNKGGDWLSFTKEVRNPYYGKSMLTCGSIKKEY